MTANLDSSMKKVLGSMIDYAENQKAKDMVSGIILTVTRNTLTFRDAERILRIFFLDPGHFPSLYNVQVVRDGKEGMSLTRKIINNFSSFFEGHTELEIILEGSILRFRRTDQSTASFDMRTIDPYLANMIFLLPHVGHGHAKMVVDHYHPGDVAHFVQEILEEYPGGAFSSEDNNLKYSLDQYPSLQAYFAKDPIDEPYVLGLRQHGSNLFICIRNGDDYLYCGPSYSISVSFSL